MKLEDEEKGEGSAEAQDEASKTDPDATVFLTTEEIKSSYDEALAAEEDEQDLDGADDEEGQDSFDDLSDDEADEEQDFGELDDEDATGVIEPVTAENTDPSTTGGIGTLTETGEFARHNVLSEKKKMSAGKKVGIVAAIVGGLVLVAYVAGCVFFHSHFGFNTVINDVDCSFKSVDEVAELVKEQVASYNLKISEREDVFEEISGSDVSLEYVEDGKIDQMLTDQKFYTWPAALFSGREESSVHATVSFDQAALTDKINALDCMQDANMVAPENAYIEYDGAAWVIQPEKLGTTLDKQLTSDAILAAVEGTQDEIVLDEAGCYVPPEITSDNEDLQTQLARYNETIPFSITYIFGDETETIPAETMYSWVVFNDDGTWYVDENLVRSWLSEFGSRHDTVGTERTFIGVDGEEHTVSGGSYGWEVDEDAEFDAIMADFANKTTENREPIYVQRAESFDSPEWGNSYVELDLTEQHVWVVVDGEVQLSCDVVTGLPTPARETSPGVWSILEMMRNKTLTGEMTAAGVPEYQTPVSYWMRMTWTGMGFHDATWQSSFGGSVYTYSGSHGCINMSYSDAQAMYGIVWVGMPVISHY